MSYNPYANQVDGQQRERIHHPQPQQLNNANQFNQYQQPQYQQPQPPHQQHQQQQYGQQYGQQYQQPQGQFQPQPPVQTQPQVQGQQQDLNFNPSAMFNDQRAAMTFQVGQNAMMAGSHYVEQNINKFVHPGEFKYYFKVSNTYVMKKLMLILFPFKNKNWTRTFRREDSSGSASDDAVNYAFPLEDTNAPDFYIPLMGIVTYIILTAMLAGLRGKFSPALLGNQWTMTIAYLLLDLAVLKGGIYVLGISSNLYDLVAYMGYKFVPLLLIVLIKNISPVRWLNWCIYIYLIIAYGFFELRAIRFNLFGGINTQKMSGKSVKSSNYFLFLYAFVGQSLLIWALSLYC